MRFEPVPGMPLLHETPLARVQIEMPIVVLEADDELGNRRKWVFETYQAVRLVTSDCWDRPGNLSVVPRTVVQLVGSPWIKELRKRLKQKDETATFLDKAIHFVIPLQDDFLEVVAHSIRCE